MCGTCHGDGILCIAHSAAACMACDAPEFGRPCDVCCGEGFVPDPEDVAARAREQAREEYLSDLGEYIAERREERWS